MLYDKPATTIDEQIALMTQRGMAGDEGLMRRQRRWPIDQENGMTAPGIDACSSVPLYVEAFFEDQMLGGATAFP